MLLPIVYSSMRDTVTDEMERTNEKIKSETLRNNIIFIFIIIILCYKIYSLISFEILSAMSKA